MAYIPGVASPTTPGFFGETSEGERSGKRFPAKVM
jgi:hypothetical protein